jgi:hypothetical protein
MSSSELVLGNEAKKLMDLAILTGQRYHSNKATKMVKGRKEKYIWAKKL